MSALFVANYRCQQTVFIPSDATCLPIWTGGPSGSRIDFANAFSNGLTSAITLWKGKVLTDNARAYPQSPGMVMDPIQGKTPILDIASTTTITRTNGSFLEDGWRAGMRIAVVGAFNNFQNMIAPQIISTVVAGTITLGTALNASDTTPGGQLQLVKCVGLYTVSVTSGAGGSGAASVSLLSQASCPGILGQPTSYLTVGGYEVLLASLGTAPSSGNTMEIEVWGGDWPK
jgi:hypothetical protein